VGQRALALHHRDLGVEQLVVHGDLAHFGFQPGDFVVAFYLPLSQSGF
jgi:hypothetical protein